MEIAKNIYGTLFMGGITIGFFYLTYAFWKDNQAFSIFLGFFAFVCAFYTSLFLVPLILTIFKRKK